MSNMTSFVTSVSLMGIISAAFVLNAYLFPQYYRSLIIYTAFLFLGMAFGSVYGYFLGKNRGE